MPIYEYYCSKCKEEYELKRPMTDMNNAAPCPKCDGSGQRLMSVFGATNGKYVRPAGKQAYRGNTASK